MTPRSNTIPLPENLRAYVGWFDSADQDEATHDPPHDGPCIVCTKPLTPDNVRTVNVMYEDRWGGKSLFYRMHRTCGNALSHEESELYDEAVLGAFGRRE